MILRELFESATNSVAIIFGRFNPPHFGHVAAWQVAAGFPEWYVGTNQSTQGPKDPLPYNIKIEAMKKLYPKLNGHLVPEQSWFTLATMVYKKHGEVTLYIVTDSTDVKIYLSMIQKQNGVEGPHGYYKFKSIEWAEAKRQSEASLVRKAVKENNPKDFEKHSGVSANTVVAGHPYFDLVRHYMLPYMEAEEEKERAAAEKAKIKAEKEANKKIKENRDLGSPFKRGSGNPLYGYDTDAMRQATGTMEDGELDEVANQPYRYMLTKKLPDARQYIFQTDSGTKFQVFFSLLDTGSEKVADVGFADQTDKDNPTIGVTGKGDAFRVFATVGAIVKEYVNSVKPDFLSFNGKTQDPGRIKLYDMIAKNVKKYLTDYEQSTHTMPGATDEKSYMLQRINNTKEDAAGVGIITKQNSTADVGPGTIKRSLRAFKL